MEFESVAEAARAMKERQHEHLGSRYIEIFDAPEAKVVAHAMAAGSSSVPAPSATDGSTDGREDKDEDNDKSEGEEETAVTARAPPGFSLSGHVLRLRGLPFSSAAKDVLDFMSGLAVVGGEAGVLFTCTPDGRPTGEAYLELAAEGEAAVALGRHKERIGSRYIEIFPSSKGDLLHAVQQYGFFTAVNGRRQHWWQGVHSGGGGSGERVDVHARAAAGIDDMAATFAGA